MSKFIGDLTAISDLAASADDELELERADDTSARVALAKVPGFVVLQHQDIDLIAANAAVARFVAPFAGKLTKIKTVLTATPSTGDPTLTAATVGVGNLSGGVLTITQSGSAVNDIDEITLTGTDNDNDVEEGELVTVTVGGAGDTGGTAHVFATFEPREAGRERNAAAARFDGSTDLAVGADFSGGNWADSDFGSLGFDMRLASGSGERYIYSNANLKAFLSLQADNTMRLLVRRASDTASAIFMATTGTFDEDGEWYRVIITWDINGAQGDHRSIFAGKVGDAAMARDTTDSVGDLGRVPDFTQTDHFFGSDSAAGDRWVGSIANFWIALGSGTNFDFVANPSDLDQFWANNKPTDLGDSPTFANTKAGGVVTPDVYLGSTSDWRLFGANAGAASGNFSVANGALLKPQTLGHW